MGLFDCFRNKRDTDYQNRINKLKAEHEAAISKLTYGNVAKETIRFINKLKFIQRNINAHIDNKEMTIVGMANECEKWLLSTETCREYQERILREDGVEESDELASSVLACKKGIQEKIIKKIVINNPKCGNRYGSAIVGMAMNNKLEGLITYCEELVEVITKIKI